MWKRTISVRSNNCLVIFSWSPHTVIPLSGMVVAYNKTIKIPVLPSFYQQSTYLKNVVACPANRSPWFSEMLNSRPIIGCANNTRLEQGSLCSFVGTRIWCLAFSNIWDYSSGNEQVFQFTVQRMNRIFILQCSKWSRSSIYNAANNVDLQLTA